MKKTKIDLPLPVQELYKNSGTIEERTYDIKDLLNHILDGEEASKNPSSSKLSAKEINIENCLPPHYRDIRRLDFSYTPSEGSIIIVRKFAVFLSFHPIRAIITSDKLILLINKEVDSVIDLIVNQIKILRQNDRQSDFEMDAYDAIFATIVELQKFELHRLESSVQDILKAHKKFTIPPLSLQEETITLKRRVADRLDLVRDQHNSLQNLLDDDDLMTLMNLTYLRENPSLYREKNISGAIDIHTQVEELLESYLLQYTSLTSRLSLLHMSLQETIQQIALRLDTAQTQNQLFDSLIGIAFSSVMLATFVPSMGGMNVKFSMNTGFEVFIGAIILSIGLWLVFVLISLISLKGTGIL